MVQLATTAPTATAPTAVHEATSASGMDRLAARHDRIDRLAHLLHTIDVESEAAWAVVDRLADEVESLWADPWATSRTRLDEARRAELGYD
jgi:hypothetical protein